VQYRGQHRTRCDVGLVGKYVGDKVPLTIVRGGAHTKLEIQLGPWLPLVPRARYDKPPQYFVYGGLVFQTLTRDYLTTWDKWWNKAPKEFLNYYYLGYRSPEQHEVVILTQILADEINVGYGHLLDARDIVFFVLEISRNDRPGRLAERLARCVTEYPLSRHVPRGDRPIQVLADDRVVGRRDDRGKDELVLIRAVGHTSTVVGFSERFAKTRQRTSI